MLRSSHFWLFILSILLCITFLIQCGYKQDEVETFNEDGVEVALNHIEPYKLEGALLLLIIAVEICIVIWIVLRIRRTINIYRAKRKETVEPYFALRYSFTETTPSPIGEFIANDIWLFYSVLSFPFRKKSVEEGKTFTYHKLSFYPTVYALVLSLMIFEGIAVHLILLFTLPSRLWWIYVIVLILNIYAIFWLIGDYINISRRPYLVRENNLSLRLGIRFSTFIEYPNIGLIQPTEKVPPKRKKRTKDTLFLSLMDTCNVYLELKNPVEFHAFFKSDSGIERIFLYLDKPKEFIEDIVKRIE